MRGRVASLLEVGTGFHPELTGLFRRSVRAKTDRENIFLNGAILGMSLGDCTFSRMDIQYCYEGR